MKALALICEELRVKRTHWHNLRTSSIENEIEMFIMDIEPYTCSDKDASRISFLLKDLLEVLIIDFHSAADKNSAISLLVDEIKLALNHTKNVSDVLPNLALQLEPNRLTRLTPHHH